MSPEGAPDPDRVVEAVRVLRAGGLVALPTETVYGLAADADNAAAVTRIFEAKGRPSGHPLIVHLRDAGALGGWATEVPNGAAQLAAAFWPGPLTVVLPKTARVLDVVTGGQPTVGLRVPAHPVALAVLRAFGGGLAAPSANRFQGVSPTTAAHVREELGAVVDLILDGGPCAVGVESTIIDFSAGLPRLLRPGGVALEAIEATLGHAVPIAVGAIRASGEHALHYAPSARVELCTGDPGELAEALRRRGDRVAVLSLPDDLASAARELYAQLRAVTADVVVAELPASSKGLGLALRDRLVRAAGPRTESLDANRATGEPAFALE